jgi:hypothetical protein
MKEKKGSIKKKNYHKPEFSLYGDIHQLTQASSSSGSKGDGKPVPPGQGKIINSKTG